MYLIHPVFMELASHNASSEVYLSPEMCFFLFVPYVTIVFVFGITLHILEEILNTLHQLS